MQVLLFAKYALSADPWDDCKLNIDAAIAGVAGAPPGEFDIESNKRFCFQATGTVFVFGENLKIEAKKENDDGSFEVIGSEENAFGVSLPFSLDTLTKIGLNYVSVTAEKSQKIIIYAIIPCSKAGASKTVSVIDTYTGVTRKVTSSYKLDAANPEMRLEWYSPFHPKGVKVVPKESSPKIMSTIGTLTKDKEVELKYGYFYVAPEAPSAVGQTKATTVEVEIKEQERDPRVPEIYMQLPDQPKIFTIEKDAGDSYTKDQQDEAGNSSNTKTLIIIISVVVVVAAVVVVAVVLLVKRYRKKQDETTGSFQKI
jgi:hypothetical protein